MPTQVILRFPGKLPEEVLRDPEILKEGKTVIVLGMLRKGSISQGRAAALLEIDREALADLMATHDIPGNQVVEQESADPTAATAGAWKGLLDCQRFEREVYESRRHHPRPEVRL